VVSRSVAGPGLENAKALQSGELFEFKSKNRSFSAFESLMVFPATWSGPLSAKIGVGTTD
jgi:hypothetical protein